MKSKRILACLLALAMVMTVFSGLIVSAQEFSGIAGYVAALGGDGKYFTKNQETSPTYNGGKEYTRVDDSDAETGLLTWSTEGHTWQPSDDGEVDYNKTNQHVNGTASPPETGWVEFKAVATEINLGVRCGPGAGGFKAYLDSEYVGTYDCWNAGATGQVVAFQSGELEAEEHTLKIEYYFDGGNGEYLTKHDGSHGGNGYYTLMIDFFDYIPAEVPGPEPKPEPKPEPEPEEDPFAGYKESIRYEMEDFAPGGKYADNWVGSKEGVVVYKDPGGVNAGDSYEASGTGDSKHREARIKFLDINDYMTLTLDDIPVSGDYVVKLHIRMLSSDPIVQIRKDSDSDFVSEGIKCYDNNDNTNGAAKNSYAPYVLPEEGVLHLEKGSDSFQIVCVGTNNGSTGKELRVDYIEIQLVGGEGIVLTPDALKDHVTADGNALQIAGGEDAQTAWGAQRAFFYQYGSAEDSANTFSFAIHDIPDISLTPGGQYYFKYAYKPRNSDVYCVVQTLANGEPVGDPVNHQAESTKTSVSNVQTPDPIGIVTASDAGELTIGLKATEKHGNGAVVVPRMWLYPVPEDVQITESLIADIPDSVTEADAEYVNQVKALFDALTVEEQGQVSNAEKLEAALKALEPKEQDEIGFDVTANPTVAADEGFYDLSWNVALLDQYKSDSFGSFNQDYEIVDHGVIVTATAENMTAALAAGTYEPGKAYKLPFDDPTTVYSHYTYRRVNAKEGVERYVTFYITYSDESGEQHTVYSDVSNSKANVG